MKQITILKQVLDKIKFITENLFKNPAVVIEIGNDWLKIIECNISGNRRVVKASFIKLSQIKESVPDAISSVFRDLKLNKNNVVTYIPRQLVTVRIIELPATDSQEISDMVNLQVGKQTPYSKEEVIFSYKVINTEKEGYTKVMLVIVKNSVVGERLAVLEKTGIGIKKVTFSSEGVYDWFKAVYLSASKYKELKTAVLLDIDSNYSDFIVIHKGILSFSRNILIGSNNLIGAEDNFLERFIEEIKRAVDVCCEEEKGIKVEKIFLSGAAKNIAGLDAIISSRLAFACEIIDTTKSIEAESNVRGILDSDNFKFISLSALFGVSLKQDEPVFSLMPNEIRIKKTVEEKKKYLTVTGILAISIFTILSFLILVQIYNKNSYMAQLKERITKIKDDSEKVDKMRQAVNAIQDRLDARGDVLNMLNELNRLLPKEIYLTSVDIERKKELVIKGRAAAMSDVFKFVTTLENSPYFKNVKNTYSTTKKEDNNEYADFEITCSYEQ